ncbi:MAG: site-2 protease family protein [Clostridia bacterium]|nr:site-2 protease family protein [Clostridia bacterium]
MTINLLAFSDVMRNVGFGALAILILMVMITVHEFGHYIVGKILGFKINEFAVGMGPAIIKKTKKNGEIFSLRLIPVGGYCAFEGEDDDSESEGAFNKKEPWKRILVLLAGATMNYLLALLVIIISMNVYGQSTLGVSLIKPYDGSDEAYISQTLENGDHILSIKRGNKRSSIYMTTDLISALNHAEEGEVVEVEVIRDGETKTIPVKLRKGVECSNVTEVGKAYDALGFASALKIVESDDRIFKADEYLVRIGFSGEDFDQSKIVYDEEDIRATLEGAKTGDSVSFWTSRESKYDWVLPSSWDNVDKKDVNSVLDFLGIKEKDYGYYVTSDYRKVGFFRSIGRSFGYSFRIGGTIFRTLGELITGRLGINSMGGTVTTIVTATKVIQMGPWYALEIISFIGVNLAVFNLLPIPALDGSKIVFCIIEWIRKKPINRKVEAIIHAIGFVLILTFAILVDVLQFI